MGFRPVSQRLRDINLQALGKFSCLALVLGLESVSHPAGPVQAPSFSQGSEMCIRDRSEIARKNLKKYGKSHSRQIALGRFPTAE